MITVIVIPVALDEPLRRVELDPDDFAAYQGLTGGNRRTHALHAPAMTLHANGVSVTPVNLRATLLLWVHSSELAGRGIIAGQAFLTGDEDGADVSVPDEILALIFEAQGYKVEVDGQSDGLSYEELALAYAVGVYHTASPETGGEVRVLAG